MSKNCLKSKIFSRMQISSLFLIKIKMICKNFLLKLNLVNFLFYFAWFFIQDSSGFVEFCGFVLNFQEFFDRIFKFHFYMFLPNFSSFSCFNQNQSIFSCFSQWFIEFAKFWNDFLLSFVEKVIFQGGFQCHKVNIFLCLSGRLYDVQIFILMDPLWFYKIVLVGFPCLRVDV